MRPALLILAILAAGCADEKALAPKFSLANVAVLEDAFPIVVRLKFTNTGIAPIKVNGLRLLLTHAGVLYDDEAEGSPPPKPFKPILALLAKEGETLRMMREDEWVPVEPKETRTIYGSFGYDAPADITPTIAVVGCQLLLLQDGERVAATESFVLPVESAPGAMEAVEQSIYRNADQLPALIKSLKAIEGAPSPRFRKMVERMEAMLPLPGA